MVTPQHIRDKNLERSELRRRVGGGRAARRRRLRARRRPGARPGARSASTATTRASRCTRFTHPIGNMLALMSLHRRRRPASLPEAARRLPGVGLRLAAVLARAPRRALGADARAGARHRPQAERVLPRRQLLHQLRARRARCCRRSSSCSATDVIVYASDYYHWDCAFPDTVKIIAERNDISDRARSGSSSDNAKVLYPLVGKRVSGVTGDRYRYQYS